MFEKELEQKLQAEHKAQKRLEKRRRRKKPCYKGHYLRNWLVYPLGVICIELDMAQAKRYNALKWSDEKALEIINKYFIEICDYEADTKELSFSMDWNRPWEAHAKKKDRLWCQKFNYELTQYLKNIYEPDGFKKSFGEGYDSDWIIFTKL